jgi:uncharacterized protein with NRDE domain
MCIVFFGSNLTEKHKFAILFNREESFKRQSLPLGFWNEDEFKNKLFYPLDCVGKGTFLCLNIENGNFCCLLNHHSENYKFDPSKKTTRGIIPIEFCKLSDSFETHQVFIKTLNESKLEYNGYNIIFGNFRNNEFYYYTNNNPLSQSLPIKINLEKVVGLSNSFINDGSRWDKRVELGTTQLKYLCENKLQTGVSFENECLKIMEDDRSVKINDKEGNSHETSIFMSENFQEYGTRHTIGIFLDFENNLKILEYFDEFNFYEEKNVNTREVRNINKLKEYKFNIS